MEAKMANKSELLIFEPLDSFTEKERKKLE